LNSVNETEKPGEVVGNEDKEKEKRKKRRHIDLLV